MGPGENGGGVLGAEWGEFVPHHRQEGALVQRGGVDSSDLPALHK